MNKVTKSLEMRSTFSHWQAHICIGIVWLLAALLLLGEAFIDHVPRFFQGDSVTYLTTRTSHIPADRSWAFGFLIRWLLETSGHQTTYLFVQLGIYLVVLMVCLAFFAPAQDGRRVAYALFVAVACLDPMLGLYARFYMSDLIAGLLFVGFLACVCRALTQSWSTFLRWLPAAVTCMTAAVFARVAYVPIALATIAMVALWSWRRKPALLGRLTVLLIVPLLSAGVLVGANMVVFATRFPGEIFLNKSAGIFLLGTFAPAVTAADFRASGIRASNEEIQELNLPNYDNRGTQIWGTTEKSAQVLIRQKLGLGDDYSSELDRVSKQIVWNAFLRNPVSIAEVYVKSLSFYFEPYQWRLFLKHELGLTLLLPQWVVDEVNLITSPAISSNITQVHSPLLDEFTALASFYPVLLLLGAGAACWQLFRKNSTPTGAIASAALVAVVISAPLYAVYVIPRYVITAVLLTYLTSSEALGRSRLFSKLSGPYRPLGSSPQC